MAKISKNCVVIILSADGEYEFLMTGNGFEVYFIDEGCPKDRIYKCDKKHSFEIIEKLIGNNDIGHSKDRKQKSIEPIIKHLMTGKPLMQIVD